MQSKSENKYIQLLLEKLIATDEIETNYFPPIEVTLDPEQISEKDIGTLLAFVSKTRKRLFLFKIDNDEQNTNLLALTAHRSILNQTAEIILNSTSTKTLVNPLKKGLSTPSSTVKANIQIQQGFTLPTLQVGHSLQENQSVEHISSTDVVLVEIDLIGLPVLANQLQYLGITKIQDSAAQQIKEYEHVFTDGIIPNNLPKGFYIDHEKHALCYSSSPKKLPSGLAPVLEKMNSIVLPTLEQAFTLLPALSQLTVTKLMDDGDKVAQKSALLAALHKHSKDVSNFLQSLNTAEAESIVPVLAKMVLIGGEAHSTLIIRLLQKCLNKKISIEFFKNAHAQNALLSPRGIKNLQKLLLLPAEQKEWWNTLTVAHLKNDKHQFDFNHFFEAYTQIFLPRINELHLTLPNPCPIQHEGHLLITLNRTLEVLEQAQNPQEQCLSLTGLDWSPTGVHYAMTQAPLSERMKQVMACMNLKKTQDTDTRPELIYNCINEETADLEPWLFRYIGQHWKSGIRLSDIKEQLNEIQKLNTWSVLQKNQLIFILTCSFSDKTEITAEAWKSTLEKCINTLKSLNDQERTDLLYALSRCFLFKPIPSLEQIQKIIEQCIELKAVFPDKNFKDELVSPLCSCLEHEGFDLFNTLQDRIQKTDPDPSERQFALDAIVSFSHEIQNNRDILNSDVITILAKVREPKLSQGLIDGLLLSIKTLEERKGKGYCKPLLSLLSQINISKSNPLPTIATIKELLATLTGDESTLKEDDTSEQQEQWLKNHIIDNNLLSGCVIGNADISKLDDLIVDALVDAIKKRSDLYQINILKEQVAVYMGYKIIPEKLKQQVEGDLYPVLDALHGLIEVLKNPNPKFEDVIEKLRFFEEKKPMLLNGNYSVWGLGEGKGANILSYILTGEAKNSDDLTSYRLAVGLSKLHKNVLIPKIIAFFEDPQYKSTVKGLEVKTLKDWMTAFSDTHSPIFFFKEELIQKKVLPALKKVLQQLNTQDHHFENLILQEASEIDEKKLSNVALSDYKDRVEVIAKYLNTLIDIKNRSENPKEFNVIATQLNSGAFSRLNYAQKEDLLRCFLNSSESLSLYIKIISNALNEHPDADANAIDRAVKGLITLFEISDLETDKKMMFFKMSVTHNLNNATNFPLTALNELKKSSLDEETKSLMMKQIIQLLSCMKSSDSPELITGLVSKTREFLTKNPSHTLLCVGLLKRISTGNIGRDLDAYSKILEQLNDLTNSENCEKLTKILTGLANSRKDDTVNLLTLLDIAKGLVLRQENLDRVLNLFLTPPYPVAETLNAALFDSGSERLQTYCSNFDLNPFAKTDQTRALAQQFSTDRVHDALLSLKDLIHEISLSHSVQLKLARQLTYIETLGYTDPLNPNEYTDLKKFTALSRLELKEKASTLLLKFRSNTVAPQQTEELQLELLAYLREIYFRTTGLFPNTTQMLMLLISINSPSTNLLMRIKTGEGKSLITPILAVLQWAQGVGTVDVCTANRVLLGRDYENNCEPFFTFLGIESTLIHSKSNPEDYKLNGINCSTLEDMSLFRLAAHESKKDAFVENMAPIHLVLDECDDALLDQTTLYKLVVEDHLSEQKEDNHAQWVYPLCYQFINLPAFRNIDPSKGKVWDEEEDLEQCRQYLNKEINEKFNGDAIKQNYLMATSNTRLRQWIDASCKAAKLVENKHFIVQHQQETDSFGNEICNKKISVPLLQSVPKTGCIFTDGVQQALQARMLAESKEQSHNFVIDADPQVLASQSARGLIGIYQNTKGRLLGISGTPGDPMELKYLSTILGTQAVGVAPYAGDKRKKHPPVFVFSPEESVRAIHQAIDKIKRPVTTPVMEINTQAIQTVEEGKVFLAKRNEALEKWNKTQTQPILIICEDFEKAYSLGSQFEDYKKLGFTIQVVTGKESSETLERMIKQAGRANTITIGTTMLSRGIDINPGAHPQGLYVVQNKEESKRNTTQIRGRASRNGKPGEWLPIYQVKAPEGFFIKILCALFPSYKQNKNKQAIEQLQQEIKLQATVERLYTQAVDQVQQCLMQQVQAWEGLLLGIYPNDPNLRLELYQWRESFLSKLTHLQESNITEKSLQSSIAHFKKSVCTLWEDALEEKWAKKASKLTNISLENDLKFKYLKQLDFAKELDVQVALQKKGALFIEGTNALMHQTLETVIANKAGAVLECKSQLNKEEMDELALAQSKQLLPDLIGELSAVYPQAFKILTAKNNTQTYNFLSKILRSIIDNIVEKKNKVLLRFEDKQQLKQESIKIFKEELVGADASKIKTLLEKIKPLIFAHRDSVSKVSLIEQFKMQGLALTFCNLYQKSGLEDEQVNELKSFYNDDIMMKLSEHLMKECAWVTKDPQPIEGRLERTVAKEAAHSIYWLAAQVFEAPKDERKIQALYTALKEHRLNLRDKYLFSIGHSSPKTVIELALGAMESLSFLPECDQIFQEGCHDKVCSEYYLKQFNSCLEHMSSSKNRKDPVWLHLNRALLNISNKEDKQNTAHLVYELYDAIERFSTYKAYKPYKNQLGSLKAQLNQSLENLKSKDGLKHDHHSSLFAEKSTQFAALFAVDASKVRIQNGTDGIQSFIEVQVECTENTPVKTGFTAYQSSFLTNLGLEKSKILELKSKFELNKDVLVNLGDAQACASVPPAQQSEFNKLFRLKTLLEQDFSGDLDESILAEAPVQFKTLYEQIKQLKQWDWNTQEVDFEKLKTFVGDKLSPEFLQTLEQQKVLKCNRDNLKIKMDEIEQQIQAEIDLILGFEEGIKNNELQSSKSETGMLEKGRLFVETNWLKLQIVYVERKVANLLKKLIPFSEENSSCQNSLISLNQSLDQERKQLMLHLADHYKEQMNIHLNQTAKVLVDDIQNEFSALDIKVLELENTELTKSRYQTHRFFSSRDLLKYQATLENEENIIPKMA